jgi:hypothetical protein
LGFDQEVMVRDRIVPIAWTERETHEQRVGHGIDYRHRQERVPETIAMPMAIPGGAPTFGLRCESLITWPD